MSQFMKFFSLLTVSAILLSGCSFADIFAKLATSNVEEGARQEYEQSKVIEAKQAKISQDKQLYPDVAELKNVSETATSIGYAFRKIETGKISYAIEAMLPSAGSQFYEVWLRNPKNNKDSISLGAMKFNQSDDYSLETVVTKDLSDYSSLIISRETKADDKPETVIMTAAFASASAKFSVDN